MLSDQQIRKLWYRAADTARQRKPQLVALLRMLRDADTPVRGMCSLSTVHAWLARYGLHDVRRIASAFRNSAT